MEGGWAEATAAGSHRTGICNICILSWPKHKISFIQKCSQECQMNTCFNTSINNCASCLPPWGSGSGTRWCARGSSPSSAPPCTAPCPAAAASRRACRSEVSIAQYCGTKYHSPGPQQVVPVQQLRDKPGVPPARLVLLTHAGATKIFNRYFIQCC